MSSQPPAIGIDLGTTFSVVAYLDSDGQPRTVTSRTGDLLTPSAILVGEDEIIVGNEAVEGSVKKPESYAECFKRDMGNTPYFIFSINKCIKGFPVRMSFGLAKVYTASKFPDN